MTTVLPLHLRLVRPEWTDRVPTPAHDALTAAARRQYLLENPDSYLAVTRGPEDTAPGTERTPAELLAEGRASLERLLETGAFSPLRPASFYLYRQRSNDHEQTAIVGGVATSDFLDGQVKLHENVRPERASHLGRHFDVVGVQSSPIALAHRPLPNISAITQNITSSEEPLLSFSSDDGLHQDVWAVSDPRDSQTIMDTLATHDLYVIDGHHRTAAAIAHRDFAGPGRADRVLSAIFSSDELSNVAHHRVLALGQETGEFLKRLTAELPVRIVTSIHEVRTREADEIAIRAHGYWHLVRVPFIGSHSSIADRLDNLDPVRLQRGILGPLLGIDGKVYDDVLSYRPGIVSGEVLASEADERQLVFAMMRAVDVDDLLAASDAGLIMPPKSTYFHPKARSGLFVRPTTDTDPHHP